MSHEIDASKYLAYKTDTIPMEHLEAAQDQGWEVYAYSEYGADGIPKFAEVRKELMQHTFETFVEPFD